MWNVSFLMMNVVETSGALVFWISVDEDCDGWRVDVCPVDGSQSGGDEIWSDDVRVDMKVEIQLVGEDGWELVEKLEVVECPMVEDDWWCALGSFLVEVAGEQVAQPLPYPPTGGWISPPALTVLFILWWRSPGSRQLDPYHTHRREAFG